VEAGLYRAFLSLFENELTPQGTGIDKAIRYASAFRMKEAILLQ
jgi:hypothetical protein